MKNKKRDTSYIEATKYYEIGEIDKALDECEEGISKNLKNSGILNLKGLLLYIKGDLEGAVSTWKINSDFNDDITAKNYIKDSKYDEERLELYNESFILIKKFKIDDAIDNLKSCLESDFNSINVNLLLSQCYLKKGDYDSASVYITKALGIDRNNKFAHVIVNEIEEFTGVKLEVNKNKRLVKLGPIFIFVCIIVIFIVIKIASKHINIG